MGPTLYASFNDPEHAESAAGALLDHGLRAEEISIVVRHDETSGKSNWIPTNSSVMGITMMSGQEVAFKSDPLGNAFRSSPAHIPQSPVNYDLDDHEGGLNPAQDDYPRTGSGSPTEFSSAPPNARRDYNPGLENKDYNKTYDSDVDRDVSDDLLKDRQRANDLGSASDAGVGLTTTGMGMQTTDPVMAVPHAGRDEDVARPEAASDDQVPEDVDYDPERAAKAGITLTTPHDAAVGALKGTGVGLGIGAVAALAAIAVPGFGLIAGGGALAAAIAGMVGTAGAGAVAGGTIGYLKDQGVPLEEMPHLSECVEKGGAMIAVSLANATLDRATLEGIMQKYGAQAIKTVGLEGQT